MKIFRISTVPFFVYTQLRNQLEYLREREVDVFVYCGRDDYSEKLKEKCEYREIDISRNISPLKDLKSVVNYIFELRKHNPDISHSTTPKAGLVNCLACLFVQTKSIHTFTGQTWAVESGLKRSVLKLVDKVIFRICDVIMCDSPSQRDLLVENGFVANKIVVLGIGSLAGIDLSRFSQNAVVHTRCQIRQKLGLNEDDKVAVFVGRINKDKGINELISLYKRLALKDGRHKLLLVGYFEDKEYERKISDLANIEYLGFVAEPETILKAVDLFVLLSKREGFGTSVIEAQAMGLPVLLSAIYGLKDCYVEGETGFSVNSNDIDECVAAVDAIFAKKDEMGDNAREFVVKNFASSELNEQQLRLYREMLSEKVNNY